MKILLTGATGYIGKRILPALVQDGHFVYCCVRDRSRYHPPSSLADQIEILEMDLLDPDSLSIIPQDIDVSYYLVHSMTSSADYQDLEQQCARNFVAALEDRQVEQVIYLSGMVNEDELSEHLQSRKDVEEILATGNYALTALRAGIIIGSGSASFEIIRDLVEKLPMMITPRWLQTRCQPIGIRDVLEILRRSAGEKKMYKNNYDIGGPDILSYKQMLLIYAEERNLKRWIWTVPVMTPRLSSYWLYFVTSTSYRLATALVDSMKVEVVARDNRALEILLVEPASYRVSVQRAFDKIDTNEIVSSWKDAQVSGIKRFKQSEFIDVPTHGCFKDERRREYTDREAVLNRIWAIGGSTGWYAANWLWKLRGYLDKLVGGVGLRRGRTSLTEVHSGDALDFWRVLYADREEGRLLLFAEMKVPGEAWLEFCLDDGELVQTATFRPQGLLGRLYWFAVLPFHGIVFSGMLRKLATG